MKTGMDRIRWIGNKKIDAVLIFAFAIVLASFTQAATPIYVNAAMPDDSGDGLTPATAKKTIQSGINIVDAGGTVNVAAGTYAEALTINKINLTIQGDGPAATLIATAGNTPALVVSANGATIKSLGITNGTQVVEGIRVSGATEGLTADNVHFVNLGNNPGPGNAFGIQVMNDFSGFTARDCRFVATHLGVNSRAIGIYARGNSVLSNFAISGCSFEYLFTGVYISSEIDGLTVINNMFGPQEIPDCTACVAGVYLGDGPNNKFDIKNVKISGNTFASFGRGVYVWEYADAESIGKFEIVHNTFSNSIYSSAVRIMTTIVNSGKLARMEGPLIIHGNTFIQDQPIIGGSGVAMIDIRCGVETPSGQIAITDNDITFNGPFALSTWGIVLRGPLTHVNITQNTLNGNNAGGASSGIPATSGIVLQSAYPGFDPLPGNATISIVNNDISGFANGIAVCDFVNMAYGGLAAGSQLNIHNNSITNNSDYGVLSGPGEVTDATNNWWGAINGPGTVGPGSGDKVSAYVTYAPWLQTSFRPKPDFAITAASGSICPWEPNGSIFGSITVCNKGRIGGEAGRLTYWADWDWNLGLLTSNPNGDAGGDIGWMEPGQSNTYVLDGLGLKAASTYGTHTLLFFVDSDQDMDEYSEGNNYVTFTYHFTNSATNYKEKPDFAITNIVLNPANPVAGQPFTAKIYIVNKGNARGNAGNLAVWVSKSGSASNAVGASAWGNIDTLNAGQSILARFDGLVAPSGADGHTHHFRAFIDCDNITAETSEGNNQKTVTYHYPH